MQRMGATQFYDYDATSRTTAKHMAIVDMYVNGASIDEIVAISGHPKQTVRLLLATPRIKAEIERRRHDRQRRLDEIGAVERSEAQSVLDKHAVRAAEKLVGQLESTDANIQFRAIRELFAHTLGRRKDSEDQQVKIILPQASLTGMLRAMQDVKGRIGANGEDASVRVNLIETVVTDESTTDRDSADEAPATTLNTLDGDDIIDEFDSLPDPEGGLLGMEPQLDTPDLTDDK